MITRIEYIENVQDKIKAVRMEYEQLNQTLNMLDTYGDFCGTAYNQMMVTELLRRLENSSIAIAADILAIRSAVATAIR